MIVAGKCPPEPEELEAAEERGFEDIELYLEKKHLERYKKTLKNVQNSDLNIVSVHTPHVHLDDKAYFWIADQLANELGAFLVFHSQYMHHTHIPELEEMDLLPEYGYENNPGASVKMVEENILKKGHNMVLDTAHLFMAEKDYVEQINYLLENYNRQIPLIHICDSTTTKDGLAFEAGEMDMEAVSKAIAESGFDGILVLEVMPEDQKEAKQKWDWYTS